VKLFRTGSSKVVNEYQVSFGFLPAKSQILIRTASYLLYFAIRLESRKSVNKRIYLSIYLYLQKFRPTVSENSLCMLFANDPRS